PWAKERDASDSVDGCTFAACRGNAFAAAVESAATGFWLHQTAMPAASNTRTASGKAQPKGLPRLSGVLFSRNPSSASWGGTACAAATVPPAMAPADPAPAGKESERAAPEAAAAKGIMP